MSWLSKALGKKGTEQAKEIVNRNSRAFRKQRDRIAREEVRKLLGIQFGDGDGEIGLDDALNYITGSFTILGNLKKVPVPYRDVVSKALLEYAARELKL